MKKSALAIMFRGFLLIAAACLIGCDDSDSTATNGKLESGYLEVLQVVPNSNSNDVQTDALIRITLDNEIDGSTVNSETFYLENQHGSLIPGEITTDYDTIIFSPKDEFRHNHSYVIILKSGIGSTGGKTLKNDKNFSFTTREYTPPQKVISVMIDEEFNQFVKTIHTSVDQIKNAGISIQQLSAVDTVEKNAAGFAAGLNEQGDIILLSPLHPDQINVELNAVSTADALLLLTPTFLFMDNAYEKFRILDSIHNTKEYDEFVSSIYYFLHDELKRGAMDFFDDTSIDSDIRTILRKTHDQILKNLSVSSKRRVKRSISESDKDDFIAKLSNNSLSIDNPYLLNYALFFNEKGGFFNLPDEFVEPNTKLVDLKIDFTGFPPKPSLRYRKTTTIKNSPDEATVYLQKRNAYTYTLDLLYIFDAILEYANNLGGNERKFIDVASVNNREKLMTLFDKLPQTKGIFQNKIKLKELSVGLYVIDNLLDKLIEIQRNNDTYYDQADIRIINQIQSSIKILYPFLQRFVFDIYIKNFDPKDSEILAIVLTAIGDKGSTTIIDATQNYTPSELLEHIKFFWFKDTEQLGVSYNEFKNLAKVQTFFDVFSSTENSLDYFEQLLEIGCHAIDGLYEWLDDKPAFEDVIKYGDDKFNQKIDKTVMKGVAKYGGPLGKLGYSTLEIANKFAPFFYYLVFAPEETTFYIVNGQLQSVSPPELKLYPTKDTSIKVYSNGTSKDTIIDPDNGSITIDRDKENCYYLEIDAGILAKDSYDFVYGSLSTLGVIFDKIFKDIDMFGRQVMGVQVYKITAPLDDPSLINHNLFYSKTISMTRARVYINQKRWPGDQNPPTSYRLLTNQGFDTDEYKQSIENRNRYPNNPNYLEFSPGIEFTDEIPKGLLLVYYNANSSSILKHYIPINFAKGDPPKVISTSNPECGVAEFLVSDDRSELNNIEFTAALQNLTLTGKIQDDETQSDCYFSNGKSLCGGYLRGEKVIFNYSSSDENIDQATISFTFTDENGLSTTIDHTVNQNECWNLSSDNLLHAPSTVNTDIENENIVLTWPTVKGAKGYNVYWGSGPNPILDGDLVQPEGFNSHTFRNLGPGTYYFSVSAYNYKGKAGQHSEIVSVTISENSSYVLDVKAIAGDSEITVLWESNEQAVTYNIYMHTQPGVSKDFFIYKEEVTDTTHTISPLENDIEHYIVATFTDSQGNESVESPEIFAISGDNGSMSGEMVFFAASQKNEPCSIWAMDIEGNGLTKLFSDAFNRNYLSISNDRTKIAYLKYKELTYNGSYKNWICIADIDGSNEQIVWQVPDYQTKAAYQFDWSFDDTKLVFRYSLIFDSSSSRDADIYELNLHTSQTINLTNNWDKEDWFPRYSPRGNKIIYTHCTTGWFRWPTDLYVMDSDGTNKIKLTNDPGGNSAIRVVHYPSFSPNGSKILYNRGGYGSIYSGSGPLYMMGSDGENNQLISISDGIDNVYSPTFSPSGQKILFYRGNNSPDIKKLGIIDLQGKLLSQIDLSTYEFDYVGYLNWILIEATNRPLLVQCQREVIR
jgi:hypothetical protein